MNKNKTNTLPDAPYADEFFEALLSLETAAEFRAFFEDVCTPRELAEITQRHKVAKLLFAKHVYNDIVRMTGASTATISRVNRSLQSGSGGYEIAFAKEQRGEAKERQ
ncbi:MAG: YerC/YecD family TrpR-related protein [Oscillospiraceae bacterium]|nr:YerC/YecD family TrpR-related protein [Oscillospiraceae bacterium]